MELCIPEPKTYVQAIKDDNTKISRMTHFLDSTYKIKDLGTLKIFFRTRNC